MTLKQLEYFTVLVQTQNYTEAARQLFVSQTTITKQIQNLENELHLALFVRDKKHVTLTEAGEVFYQEAKRLLAQAKSSLHHLEAFQRGEEGRLNIGFLKSFDFETLQSLISGFHQRYPRIQLELGGYFRTDLEHLLESGDLDVILSINTEKTPDFHKVFFKNFPLVAVIPREHPLSSRKSIKASDLKNLIYDIRQEKDDQPNRELEGALLQVSCQLGEAIANEFVIQPHIRPYVCVIPLEPRQGRDIYMMYQKERFNRLVSQLESYMKSQTLTQQISESKDQD